MAQDDKLSLEIRDDERWTLLSSERLFDRPWLSVRRDHILLPTGQVNDEFYVLEYPDWVNVIAITEDGKFVMERQYRHGLGVMSIEIPAGVVENGEDPLEAAKRELLEETGYSGGTWEENMVICGNSSTTNNYTHSFIARGVVPTGRTHLDRTEALEPILLSAEEVRSLLEKDRVKQALMAAPLWKFFAREGLL